VVLQVTTTKDKGHLPPRPFPIYFKLSQPTSCICLLMCLDCAYWIRRLARQVEIIEYENGGSQMTVASIAKLLGASLRESRGMELSVGTMIAGFDRLSCQPALFYVDSEGSCVPGDVFCVGSGANLAYSILDDSEKKLGDMTVDEAVDVATWALRHATFRDSFSGGYINVIYINGTGCHHLKRIDVRTMRVSHNGE
jgi:20S proteasome alpha/beta subunit